MNPRRFAFSQVIIAFLAVSSASGCAIAPNRGPAAAEGIKIHEFKFRENGFVKKYSDEWKAAEQRLLKAKDHEKEEAFYAMFRSQLVVFERALIDAAAQPDELSKEQALELRDASRAFVNLIMVGAQDLKLPMEKTNTEFGRLVSRWADVQVDYKFNERVTERLKSLGAFD